jgi:glutathione peroxidase-family protein
MSRKIETSVYSLEGNSIWDVVLKFERLGLQEINKFPETVFQGQDLKDTRAAFTFKTQFDKLFTLIKEFYVKINGTQNMYNSINDELAKTKFMKEIDTDLEGFKFQDSIDRIRNKMTRTLSSNDAGFLKYAKLEMVLDG